MRHFEYEISELFPVISELATEYCGGDHSSVPYEQAQEFMEAVCYCILEYEHAGNNTLVAEKVSAKDAYLFGRKIVAEKFEELQKIYGELMMDFEDYGLECLKSTMESGIPEFIKRYDIRFAPQETHLMFEYPVFGNISELSGVDAVLEYVKGVQAEQKFLKIFEQSYILNILLAYDREYESFMENICEIVWMNTAGHLILKKPLQEQGISSDECSQLENILRKKTVEELESYLEEILKNMTERYFNGDLQCYHYFAGNVSDVVRRLKHHAACHTLDKIFLI